MSGMARFARGAVVALAFSLPLGVVQPMTARAQSADSTGSHLPLFTYRDAILAGAFIVTARLVHPLDKHYHDRLQDSSTQANRKLQLLATFVRTTATPGSYVIGTTMYVTGRLANNHKLASLGLHGTEALAVGEGVASVVKMVVGRQRPSVEPSNPDSYQFMRGLGSDAYRSFPSGHTVSAFAAAAAVTAETSRNDPSSTWYVAPIMYGGAALVGISRMYNNRHWASDVIVGAGIGTFAGLKVVRFNDSHTGNKVDRFFLNASVTPTPDGGHALHLSLLPASALGLR